MADTNEKILKGMKDPSTAISYLGSRLRGEWIRNANALRGSRREFGRNLRVRGAFRVRGPGKVRIGDDVMIEGGPYNLNSLYTYAPDAEIRIGSKCILGGLRVSCRSRVEIGDWCLISDSRITDNDQHSIYPNRRDPAAVIETRPVIIEDNVWVCLAVIILKGVRIGKNSIVAAGSLVTDDIPPNSIAAGHPARVIRAFSPEDVRRAEEFFATRERYDR